MQIFIASPGGLDPERLQIRNSIDKFNQRSGFREGIVFAARGWEDIPGGLGRPQSTINDVIDDCDFMIVVLADRWGSFSEVGGTRTGTEEEFERAISLCGQEDASMRDVLVLFQSVSADRVRDAGPELTKVLEFKERLESSKALLYDTFDTEASLAEKISGILDKWKQDLGPRTPTIINLGTPDSTGSGPAPLPSPDQLERAIELASEGKLVQAEILFARAAGSNSPKACSEYARFLRRQGRLHDSKVLNEQVVSELAAAPYLTSQERGLLTDSLANIGVINRKSGNLAESLNALEEAVKLAKAAPTPIPGDLAYALDNLGHTQSSLGMLEPAKVSFDEASSVRIGANDTVGSLRSLLNSGWLANRTGSVQEAHWYFSEAERLARESDDEDALVRALAGLGSTFLGTDRPRNAIVPLKEALEKNTQLGQSDGISITAGMLARAYVATGDPENAQIAAREALAQSQRSANPIGLATAKWVLGQIERLKGNKSGAAALYDEAIDIATRSENASLKATIKSDFQEGAPV